MQRTALPLADGHASTRPARAAFRSPQAPQTFRLPSGPMEATLNLFFAEPLGIARTQALAIEKTRTLGASSRARALVFCSRSSRYVR